MERRVKKSRLNDPVDYGVSDDDEDEDDEERKDGEGDRRSKNRAYVSSHNKKSIEREDDEYDEMGNDYDEVHIETGQITRVFVKDFMCHRKFTVDFGRHVNFITGQNGSGKSAIVAALQLCLGATARSTWRGSNMGALVREGADGPAVLQVTLLNEGSDAYLPECYGNRIIIERRIPRTGSSTYRLLNKDGTLVCNRKEELDKILQMFNLFADNPCCILTQEESKKFIQGHEKDKYNFFMKASGLDVTKEEIEKVRVEIDVALKSIDGFDVKLRLKKEELGKLKEDYKQLMALDKYADEIQEYLAKIYWRDVLEADQALEELNTTLAARKSERDGSEELLLTAQQAHASLLDVDSLGDRMEEIQRALSELGPELEVKTIALSTARRRLNGLDASYKEVMRGKADMIRDLEDVKKRIKDLTQKAMADAEGSEKSILQDIDVNNRSTESFRRQENELRGRKQQVSVEQTRLEDELRRLSNGMRGTEIEIRQKKDEKAKYANSRTDKLSVFGHRMPEIVRVMSQKTFRGPVFGPLGNYVKIDSKFSKKFCKAIEKGIKERNLQAFVVTCNEDRNVIAGILSQFKVGHEHAIHVHNLKPRYKVDHVNAPGSVTISDALIIDNDLVHNVLVNIAHIESIVLVNDYNEAIQTLTELDAHGKLTFKKFVSKAMDPNGVSITVRAGNKSQRGTGERRGMLAEDLTEILRDLDGSITYLEELFRSQQGEHRDLRTQVDRCKGEERDLEGQLRNLGERLKQLHRQKLDLESQREECQSASQIDVTPLEQERDDREEAIRGMEAQCETIKTEIDGAKAALTVVTAEKSRVDTWKRDLSTQLKEMEERLQDTMGQRENARRNVDACLKAHQIKEKQVADVSRELETRICYQGEKVDFAKTQTRELLGERWDGEPYVLTEKETKERLRATIASKEKQLERGKLEAGLSGKTKESLHAKILASKRLYIEEKRKYDDIERLIEGLEADHTSRSLSWVKLLKANSKTVRRMFDKYLQKKGFSGSLEFDHGKGSLHITCQTDNTDERTQCVDVRQLSGGERSYTTLCLLMALGHVIESPFRLMDEYDVFLDEHSRRVTLNNLQEYALKQEQRGRQFIIITPQNLNDIKTSSDVRIKTLAAPSRLSATGLQQQTL